MVQEHLLVVGPVEYLVGNLVLFMLLHDAWVVDQQRPIIDWPQTELSDARAGLAVCLRILRVLTLCHSQVKDCSRRDDRLVLEVAIHQ